MASSHSEKLLLGEAGEHLVISRLLRHGHLAGQTPRTWRADDVLIHGGQSIQVKTTKGAEWLISKDLSVDPRRFYALVDYRELLAPLIYVLPTRELAQACRTADRRYYEQRPASKPFDGYVVRDGWTHDVPEYPAGWLQSYLEAWDQLAQVV